MRLLLINIFIIGFSICLYAQENEQENGRMFGIEAETGINYMKLGELSDIFTRIVDIYKANELPMQVQTLYPENGLAGASFYLNLSGHDQLKLNYYYSSTKAYSFYGDYSGTLDLKSTVKMHNISISYTRIFFPDNPFTPYGELSTGYLIIKHDIQEKVSLTGLGTSDASVGDSDRSFVIEPGIGFRYHFSIFHLYVKGSYKFTISDPQDVSGATLKSGIGIEFGSIIH